MNADLNRPARYLRRITSPIGGRKPRNYCPSCERTVEPRVDSRGLFCPWCHQDIPTAMERGMERTT